MTSISQSIDMGNTAQEIVSIKSGERKAESRKKHPVESALGSPLLMATHQAMFL
jgi:hypothetical protein